MKKTLIAASLALTALLSAAVFADEAKTPEFRYTVGNSLESAQPKIDAKLNIEQSLELAFANNPGLINAVNAANESSWSVYGANSAFKPTFDASASHTRMGKDVSTDNHNTGVGVSAALPLDINKRIGLAAEMARYGFDIRFLSLTNEAQSLIYNVKNAYYNYLRAEAAREVSEKAVDAAKRLLQETESRYKAGAVPKYDFTAAQVDAENQNQGLIRAETNVDLARIAFNNVLGIDPTSATAVEKVNVDVSDKIPGLNESIETAFANSPLMKLAEDDVKLAETNIKFAKAQKKPSLALTAGYNYYFRDYVQTGSNNVFQAGIMASMPLFERGSIKADIAKAQVNAEDAKTSMDRMKLNVSSAVQTAVYNMSEAYTRIKSNEASVSLAEESLRLANIRYREDIGTLVEVLNAETLLTTARTNEVNALYDYAVAKAAYEQATATQPELGSVRLLDDVIIDRGTDKK